MIAQVYWRIYNYFLILLGSPVPSSFKRNELSSDCNPYTYLSKLPLKVVRMLNKALRH
jgi:hypothetical protein